MFLWVELYQLQILHLVIFKNYSPFTDWISEINNTKVDNAQVSDMTKSMYHLIEYNNIYL